MYTIPKYILVLNAGSSSIKFAVYTTNGILNATHYGSVENIGKSNTTLHCTTIATNQKIVTHLVDNNFEQVINYLVPWFSTIIDFAQVIAVGHRIVHGFAQQEVQLITPSFFDEMKKLLEHNNFIQIHGEDMPEILQWKWNTSSN